MNNNENIELINKEQLKELKELLELIDPENNVFGKTKELIIKREQDKNKEMNK